ncbi:Enterobactin exporter EntS [Paenibacillus plantiphilus]|uniref:Enterobactin exporter EntS n=1 Tax=Paenibacillus plantiphilus TaxID=2905650 RepID=A0ABN8GF39_9BACL|nr:MFS transporter [Paenibacillus plantiphilus]CAH1203708.1 Enterobactin exporter EntS [Paenibacillus plantiphilus]
MVFSVLKPHKFRFYFIADIVSGFGVGMSTIGANWYLMEQTGSIASVGFMLSLNVIAGFLISAFAGPLIDKWNRRTIILWANGIRAITLLLIAGAFLWTGFRIEYLYAFAVINGMGWTVYMSASRSLVQEILPEKDLIHGNSLIEISLQVGMFVAGALSGLLFKYVGFEVILLLNALAFIISSLFLSRIRHTPIPVDNEGEPFFETFKNGIRYLAERPYIFLLGIVSIIPLVSTMVYNVVLPGYVSTAVKGDSVVFGLSDMFYGIGALLSGFIAAPLAKKLSQNGTILLVFLISVLTLAAVAFNTMILILYAGSVLIGLTNSSLRILITTTLMKSVSKTYMGRATSVWMAISLLLQTVSATGLGVVIDRYSPGWGFVCMSGLMLIGLVVYYVLNSREPQQKTLEA